MSMDQWQDYDHRYEALSQWLKDTEGHMRNESALKPDLPAKKEQLDLFKVINVYFKGIKEHKVFIRNKFEVFFKSLNGFF